MCHGGDLVGSKLLGLAEMRRQNTGQVVDRTNQWRRYRGTKCCFPRYLPMRRKGGARVNIFNK